MGNHTAQEVAKWMGEILFVRGQTLTHRHAAQLVRKLFGSEFLESRHRLAQPVLRELKSMFNGRLRWDARRERWSAKRSSRANAS